MSPRPPILRRLVGLSTLRPLAGAAALLVAPIAFAATVDAVVTYRPDARTLALDCRAASAGACTLVVSGDGGGPRRATVDVGASATLTDVGDDARYCVDARADASWESCPKTRVSAGPTRHTYSFSD